MKKLIILSLVVLISVFGCKKKPTKTNCYVCNYYELVYAPIFTQYNQQRALIGTDTLCGHDDAWIQMYMDTHKPLDTIKHGIRNDTIVLDQHSAICDLQ